MMVIIAGIVIALLCLSYVFYKRNYEKRLQKKLNAVEEKLIKSSAAEHQLQEEVNVLQHKLQSILEDPVTNLLGWKLFEDRLNQSIKESQRYQLTLGMLFIDIDDFDVINNTLNYEIGDALLQEVGMRLKSCIRQVDSLTRFAKDTFVVLLSQLAKPESAAIVAQRILQALAQPFQIQGHELYITACIGISIYPLDGQNGQSLLRCASHALHLAKEKGKHLYQFYQEKMYLKSQRELSLNTGLSRESVFQEFLLYYQPIINVETKAIICMDVLLHWHHADLGIIHPNELLSCAEKQLKSNVITEWLLRHISKQYQQWRSLGFSPEFIGIPLSIKQLENSHFIYHVSQLLQELELKPESILLEIQESANHVPPDVLEKAFNMLNFIGVKIAINNFGTGSISLSHLKNLSVNYIKLDPLLIQDIHTQQAAALIKSLVFMAKNMSLQIIAQGVESDQQVALLKELGCTLMQGQLIGPPLAENEVIDKIVSSAITQK